MIASIPFFDVAAVYRRSKVQIDAAVTRVLSSGHVVLGPEVEAFEAEFAAYVGTRHAIAVGSGTDALSLALRAVGVSRGDEVITVANAGVPPAAAICAAGGTPRFVDVDPQTLLMDVGAAQAADAVNTLKDDLDLGSGSTSGNNQSETLHRLKEGIERFLITDINDPSRTSASQSSIVVMWDLINVNPNGSGEYNHVPGGGNVAFMDGHGEFIKYDSIGVFPINRAFGNAVLWAAGN